MESDLENRSFSPDSDRADELGGEVRGWVVDEGMALLDELDAWYDDFRSDETSRRASLAYFLSPAWEQLRMPGWEAYDALAERQEAMEAPRLDWQDDEEADRENCEIQRSRWFKPMEPHLFFMCPLWAHLKKYQGLHDGEHRPTIHGWDSMLNDWDQFQQLARHDAAFSTSLSPTHRRSLALLTSWWDSAYCDPELLQATVEFLEKVRTEETFVDPSQEEDMLACGPETQTDTSLYHAQLFQLFLFEFHPQCWEPFLCGEGLFRLENARYLAARMAARQKLAHAVLHPGQTSSEPYPLVVISDTGHPGMTEAQFNRRPYYLWDVEAGQTVQVAELPECPEYTCISHTWGRWRTRTDAAIPGVPWPVPENTRYDVRDVPRQLRCLNIRYVWLDLFCIPQSKTSERAKLEIANQASIFKRSSQCIAWINDVDDWDGVLRALDWLSLQGLRIASTRHFEAISELMPAATAAADTTPAMLYRHPELSFWFSSLWTLQEAILCPNTELWTRGWTRLEDRRGTPITLQALMVIISETARYIRLEEPPVPYAYPDTFVKAVANHPSMSANETDPLFKTLPTAVRDILQFWLKAAIEIAVTMGPPVDIFMNADKRTCTSSRAPAIMSALGITDWYLEAELGDPPAPQRLVFGKYPVAFLQEAAAKLGAIFYFHASSSLSRVGGRQRQMRSLRRFTPAGKAENKRKRSGNSSGDLLPVSQIRGRGNGLLPSFEQSFVDKEDHCSVATWTINENGSVTLPEVGIVASSSSKLASSVKIAGQIRYIMDEVNIYGRFVRQIAKTLDLQQSLKDLRQGARQIHAVALFRDLSIVRGVLLELCDVSYDVLGRHCFKKIGEFRAVETPLPPTTKVDWTVL